MAKLTNKQMEILGIYIGAALLSIFLGLLFAGKGRHGLGLLVGINIAVSTVSLLYLTWGRDAWKKNAPTRTPAPTTTAAPSK